MKRVKPDEWLPQGVAELEDRAWEALRETQRSVCVTAGAGAGKTEFLAQKGTYLLQTGICPPPKRILAISFKRDAARNLADRIAARCPAEQARRFDSMTFDAFTKHLIDQFRAAIPEAYRPTADYEVTFATRDRLNAFLQRVGAPNVNTDRLERAIAHSPLPIADLDATERQREILQAYWDEQYAGDRTYLTFPMINRLAELLIRRNPRIQKVIRATYPFVFLDEFQDTTYSQFQLIQTTFNPRTTIFTAVGDDKQKIMGWAGAMANAFDEFTATYNARCISLLSNWRSHDDLVAIQHVIARRIDPNVEPVVARQECLVDGDIAAIWPFDDRNEEIEALADWIAAEVALGEVKAHEIAVLVRMLANRVEEELAPALARHGIVLRNVARSVGEIAIQDLLTEDFTRVLMPLLRLGARRRDSSAWAAAQHQLARLEAVAEGDEESQQRITARLESVVRHARTFMAENAAGAGLAGDIVDLLLDQLGEQRLRQATAAYHRDADYLRVKEGFVQLLDECATDSEEWSAALDRFDGIDQVPLMTIHKSKGLEFHTMIFFGLDTRSWRSLTPESDEELNAFFVAFTRARQRAFFSCCNARGGRIDWLEDLLGDSVPRVELA